MLSFFLHFTHLRYEQAWTMSDGHVHLRESVAVEWSTVAPSARKQKMRSA